MDTMSAKMYRMDKAEAERMETAAQRRYQTPAQRAARLSEVRNMKRIAQERQLRRRADINAAGIEAARAALRKGLRK